MAVFTAILIYFVLAASYLVGNGNVIDAIDRTDIKWKLDFLASEFVPTAEALRNVIISTNSDKIRLSTIATGYMMHLDFAANLLYSIAPVVLEEDGYDWLMNATAGLEDFNNKFKAILHEKPDVLKEKLATLLEGCVAIAASVKKTINFDNEIITSQFDCTLDVLIYGAAKVKQQALYFQETYSQLSARISSPLSKIGENLNSYSTSHKGALIDLRHISILQESLIERSVNRMQRWIELNPANQKGVKIVEEVIDTLTELFKKTSVNVRLPTFDQLKSEVLSVHLLAAKSIATLSGIEFEPNSVGQEYIRSTMFDPITESYVIEQRLKKIPYKQ